ncbi:MAG: helix-turn-helix domain-containing protein [Clostridiales bacterium]|nr:helix-turn-helix domain-containing protein [Clostridiales bacterium]
MAKNYTKFSARLKELREEKGVSMIELARAIGVSDAAVCKWENGVAEPKLGYIIRLAEYFDCSIDYMSGNDGEYSGTSKPIKIAVVDSKGKQVKAGNHTPVVLTPDESQIIGTYNVLTPDMKKLFKETLRTWRSVNAAPTDNKKTDTD